MTNALADDLDRYLASRREARSGFLGYLRHVWWMGHPLIIGRHTRMMAAAIDEAIDLFFQGVSSIYLVEIPVRHGKSDLISRAAPGYFLGRCRMRGVDPDVVMSGYGGDLVQGFSKDAKQIIRSGAYHSAFPGVAIARGSDNVSEWRLEGCYGKVVATGLGGSLTGKGYMWGSVDDYCKNREEAESEVIREKVWNSFTNDMLTRRAPVSITFVVATPWHVDGLGARLLDLVGDKAGGERFKHLRLPARELAADGTATYLFPERYSPEWYESQYRFLGTYCSSGLMDCQPVPAEGNTFRKEWFPVAEPPQAFTSVCRAWDLAASSKRYSNYTSGALLGLCGDRIWVLDVARKRVPAGAVARWIAQVGVRDGKQVEVVVERQPAAGAIATESILDLVAQQGLPAYSTGPITGDKLTRALPFSAHAESGRVFLAPGEWNEAFLEEIVSFPSGKTDDQVDASAHAYNHLMLSPVAGVMR